MILGGRFPLVRFPSPSEPGPSPRATFTFHDPARDPKDTLPPRLHIHRPGWLTRHARPDGPGVSVLMFAALLGVGLALACWGLHSWFVVPLGAAGNDLRAEVSSSKLNTTSAEVPPDPPTATPQTELDRPKQDEQPPPPKPPDPAPPAPEPVLAPTPAPPAVQELPVSVPALPPVPPLVPEVPPVEPPGPLPIAVADPVAPACTSIYVPQRGDTPMMRNWKVLALAALLAPAVDPGIVIAGGSDGVDLKAVMKRLEKLEETLLKGFKAIGEDVTQLRGDGIVVNGNIAAVKEDLSKAKDRIEHLEKQIDLMRIELAAVKQRQPATTQALYPPEKTNLDEIKTRLGDIEKMLSKLNTPSRTALSPSPVGTSRVKLVNGHVEELLFLINGRAFRVAPGVTQVLEQVPSGAFTYEVVSPTWGLRGRNAPTLAPGEEFTITAQ